MARANTNSFILTLKLDTQKWQEDILEKRFRIAKNIYNSCIGEQYKRYNRMIQSKEYTNLTKKIKRTYREEDKIKHLNKINKTKVKYNDKYRKELFKERNKLISKNGLTEYDMHSFVKNSQNKFKDNIDSFTAQKIATNAYRSLEKMLFGNGKKMYFKSELESLEGKANRTGIRLLENKLMWIGLSIPVIIKKNDYYAQMALTNRIKYNRIVRKLIRGTYKYYIQVVLEGIPPKKIDNGTGMFKVKIKDKTVGIDIGTQTIAISSDNEVKLMELAPNIQNLEIKKKRLQRKMDRQKRANNPGKFNENGTIKKGNRDKWVWSKNYIKTKNKLADISRKQADIRKQDHYKLCNYILSLGNDVKVEKMNYKGLQSRSKKTEKNEQGRFKMKKRFGKSLANKAPAMFLTMLDNKLKFEGKELQKINTTTVKASQYNHIDDKYIKCKLSDRWKQIGEHQIQRDLYSAFLIMNVNEKLDKVDRDLCFKTFNQFKHFHDIEIERVRNSNDKIISSMGI